MTTFSLERGEVGASPPFRLKAWSSFHVADYRVIVWGVDECMHFTPCEDEEFEAILGQICLVAHLNNSIWHF